VSQRWLESTPWSALTSQRFGRSRPVAAMFRLNSGLGFGVKPPKAKAATAGVPGAAAALGWSRRRTPKSCVLVLMVAVLGFACSQHERRSVPPEVESTVSSVGDDIAAGRYEKIYNEASELWRQDATLEQSVSTFKTLRAKLGLFENRVLQSATEQQNAGGPLKGRAFIVNYRTRFQNGEAMETFTLVERDRQWLLARYFVSSTALK
jgi:hypothetical protein